MPWMDRARFAERYDFENIGDLEQMFGRVMAETGKK
jgi:hypothetical protein